MCRVPSTAAQSLTESPPTVYCQNVPCPQGSRFTHFLHTPAAETFQSHHRLGIFQPTFINGPLKG